MKARRIRYHAVARFDCNSAIQERSVASEESASLCASARQVRASFFLALDHCAIRRSRHRDSSQPICSGTNTAPCGSRRLFGMVASSPAWLAVLAVLLAVMVAGDALAGPAAAAQPCEAGGLQASPDLGCALEDCVGFQVESAAVPAREPSSARALRHHVAAGCPPSPIGTAWRCRGRTAARASPSEG